MPVNPETTVRKMLSMPRDMWERIEDYRFENRIKTESEAIRRLIELGLQACPRMWRAIVIGAALISMSSATIAQIIGPAPDGEPVAVARTIISENFEKRDCPKVLFASRLQDGSIKAGCSNRETYRILVFDKEPIAMRCSVAASIGVSGC